MSSSDSSSSSASSSAASTTAASEQQPRFNGIRLSEVSPALQQELSALDETGDGMIDEQEILHMVRDHKERRANWKQSRRRYRVVVPVAVVAVVALVGAIVGITYGVAESTKEIETGLADEEVHGDAQDSIAYSTATNDVLKVQGMPSVLDAEEEEDFELYDEATATDAQRRAARALESYTLGDFAPHRHAKRAKELGMRTRDLSTVAFTTVATAVRWKAKRAFDELSLNPEAFASIKIAETKEVYEIRALELGGANDNSEDMYIHAWMPDFESEILLHCEPRYRDDDNKWVYPACALGPIATAAKKRGSYCDISGHTSSYEAKDRCKNYWTSKDPYNGDSDAAKADCLDDGACYWVGGSGGYCWLGCADQDWEDACEDFGPSGTTLCYWKDNDCFSGDSTVAMEDGSVKKMSDVQPGDMVQVGAGEYAAVSFLDAEDADAVTMMTRVHLSDGSVATSTPSHNWMVAGEAKAARDLVRGDELTKADGSIVTVESSEMAMEKGLYSPITSTGTIVVDGTLASSYALPSGISQGVAHALVTPIRALAYVSPSAAQFVTRSMIGLTSDVKSDAPENHNVIESFVYTTLTSASTVM